MFQLEIVLMHLSPQEALAKKKIHMEDPIRLEYTCI